VGEQQALSGAGWVPGASGGAWGRKVDVLRAVHARRRPSPPTEVTGPVSLPGATRGSGDNGTESHANVAASAHAFAPPDPSGIAFAQVRSTATAYEPSHNEVGVRPWK